MESNWRRLPREVAEEILSRVDDFDIVRSAQLVCSSWRSISRDPRRWRKIDMRIPNHRDRRSREYLMACLRAVDYSSGNLESVTVYGFGIDDLLRYIAQRSSKIKILKLHNCERITDNGICSAFTKLPLLETLELTCGSFSGACIESLGRNCPRLKSLTFHRQSEGNDNDAIAIAGHLPGLRSLDIAGNGLTDAGVEAILEGCPLLQKLDLRRCPRVNFNGDLQRICEARRGHLRISFCSPPRIVAIFCPAWPWIGQDKARHCRNGCEIECSHDSELSDSEIDDDDEFYDSGGDDEDEIGESEGGDDDDRIFDSENDNDNEVYESDDDDEIRDSENDNDNEVYESDDDDEIRDSENDDDDEFYESENEFRQSEDNEEDGFSDNFDGFTDSSGDECDNISSGEEVSKPK